MAHFNQGASWTSYREWVVAHNATEIIQGGVASAGKAITRRRFVSAGSAIAFGAFAGSALVGCGESSAPSSGSASSTDKAQAIVTMTLESEPAAGFNPVIAWGDGEHVHEPLIQSTLITTDVDLNFVNDLATSYDCSEDGLLWTFEIRDDVKFTDGVPLTAADVAFTINTIIAEPLSEADLSMVDEAVAMNDTTVEIHLNKPFNALLYTLSVVGIVPEHAYGPDYGTTPENTIGSGRYMLVQWDRGQQVILTANPDYYGEKPLISRVVVLFMGEDASLIAAQAGQVDVAYASAILADEKPEGYALLDCKSVDSRGISLPTLPPDSTVVAEEDMAYQAGNAVTSDVAVRRAMNYGLNREAAVDGVLGGYGTVAYSVSDGMPWISPDMACDYDPEYAASLLEDAGWHVGADGVREKDGVRAEVTLWYSAGDSVRQAFAFAFADDMEKLGIKVNVTGASFDDIYPHQYADPVLWGWGSNSPAELYNLCYSSGWGNFPCYDSATVDAYFDEALAQHTVEDSYAYWQDGQWDGTTGIAPQGAATWVWIANVNHLYFTRDGLHVAPQKPHPHGHGWSILNNVDRWTWE